jgi:uncharacterized protein (DUF1778 family)
MATEQQTRDRLIGFRVTQHEHSLLRQVAAADERNLTGLLRKILAETVTGFGATKLQRTTEQRERSK